MVVVGELLFGFRSGTRYDRNARELDELLAQDRVGVLPVTRTTADRFGRIAAALRKAGTPIPSNDIWIAAHALESGGELVSFDRHFEAVPGLVWVRPSQSADVIVALARTMPPSAAESRPGSASDAGCPVRPRGGSS